MRAAPKFSVQLEFRSADLAAKLKPLCEKVFEQFLKLPSLRLLCYVDNEYPESLLEQFGELTALHTPIRGSGTWPNHVQKYFLKPVEGGFAFDDLIYIPRTKYVDQKVAFVIALAHEVQHFVQRRFAPKVSRTNTLLLWNLARFDPTTQLKPWELPNNREAMIVAKHVAENICGSGAVKKFVRKQIDDGRKTDNIIKTQLWEWVQTLNSSTCYDLLKETDNLVKKYRQQLRNVESEIDFLKLQWWL